MTAVAPLNLLARQATAIREVIAGRIDPIDALHLTVWPSELLEAVEGDLTVSVMWGRVNAMRGDFRRPGRLPEARTCKGCGSPVEARTSGCRTCDARWYSRTKRGVA